MEPELISIQIEGYLAQLLERALLFLPKVIAAVILFIITLYVAALLAKAVRRVAQARQVDPELTKLFSRITRWGVITTGALWALQIVDQNIIGFIAGLGIAGFTIGFALQDITKNFVAGILLLLQQPFDVGDAIKVVGYEGFVIEVSLRATELRTFDGLHVTIPNADVYINPITNYTRADKRRVALEVGVAYDSDLDKVTTTALDAIRRVPGVILDAPAPSVVFKTFGDSAILFTLYYWIDLSQTGVFPATDMGVKLLKAAFERENIEIPYPLRTVLLQSPPPHSSA